MNRDAEFAAAATRREVDLLQAKWEAEDEAREAAKSWQQRQLVDLCRRVARLEQERAALIGAIGEVIGKHVRQVLDQRPELAYRGTWSAEENYARNSLATFDGGMWLAIGSPIKGRRPKADPSWRLVVKTAPNGSGFA